MSQFPHIVIGNLLKWSLIIIIGCYIGVLILYRDPYLSLISISIPLAFALMVKHEIPLYILVVSIFFADWLHQLGLIPNQMTWLPDIILVYLMIKIVLTRINSEKPLIFPVAWPIFIFILLGIFSSTVNSQSITTMILGFRADLKFVLMFYILINLNLERQSLKRMAQITIILLIVQVPVALAKLPFYGQGERAIGTYAVHGGEYSTILPLAAISIFIGFFFFERPRLLYIFYCFAFVIFSIVGGKRGFIYFLSLLLPFLAWQAGKKNLLKFSLALPVFILSFYLCIYFVPSLKPALEDPRHIISFATNYTSAYAGPKGEASGRFSAAKEALQVSAENPVNLMIGFGPGSASKSYFKKFAGKLLSKLRISYGWETQWVVMSLEYGIVGVFLFLLAIFLIFKRNQRFFERINDPYWRAISFGFKGISFTYFMGFFYATVFRQDVMAFIFWFFAASIYCLEHESNPVTDAVNA